MSRYKREITVDSDLQQCYNSSSRYFSNIGYQLKYSSFPSTIDFLKIGSMWRATEIDQYTHEIILLFNEINNYKTSINILVLFPDLIGKIREKDMLTFEPIFQGLQSEISHKISTSLKNNPEPINVVQKEKIIERQIVKVRCRYCGALNNDGQTKCEICGALL
jgi:ribosomal protein L40E